MALAAHLFDSNSGSKVVSPTSLQFRLKKEAGILSEQKIGRSIGTTAIITAEEEQEEEENAAKDIKKTTILTINSADRSFPSSSSKKVDSNHPTESQAKTKRISLPGADGHEILTLSDEEIASMPVDILMSSYGEATGGEGGTCGDDYGNRLIKRWRSTRKRNCDTSKSAAIEPLRTSIDCFLMHQNHHHGSGDNLCLMENIAVNLGIFADEPFTTGVITAYVRSRHEKQAYPPFPSGFMKGDCDTNSKEWDTRYMPGWNADLTTKAFKKMDETQGREICHEWIEHPVLIQQRDTFANFFHDSEDFVNVFLAMAILQWKPSDTQVFLMDLYPKGPFW